MYFEVYTVQNCWTIYRNLLVILVASKTVNLQKSYKSIINCTVKMQQTLACCKIVLMAFKLLVNISFGST